MLPTITDGKQVQTLRRYSRNRVTLATNFRYILGMGSDETESLITGICKLCLQPARLRKSHILPKMAYAEVIDKKAHPRMVVVRDVVDGQISDKNQQTGYWEWLLCQSCETQFSKYETYASEHLFRSQLAAPANPKELLVRLDNLQYQPLKLFLLSILWRASVAKGPYFRCLDLGPQHEENLRRMLRAEDPGQADEYGCVITPLLPEPVIPVDGIVAMPARTRVDGHNGCLFQFRGFAFQFYVSRHRIPGGIQQAFLNPEGQLLMLRMRMGDFQPLRKLWNRCIDAIHREKRAEEAQGQ